MPVYEAKRAEMDGLGVNQSMKPENVIRPTVLVTKQYASESFDLFLKSHPTYNFLTFLAQKYL